MATRLDTGRIALDLDGVTVEVEPIRSWSIQFEARTLLQVFTTATTPAAEYTALGQLFDYVAAEAQPHWDFTDHRGPIPTTGRGFHRLGLPLSMRVINDWIKSFKTKRAEPKSAVDKVIPPGPLNRQIKQRLQAVKDKQAA